MNLFLRLLLALAASFALAAPSTRAAETASGLFAASANEEHTYYVVELGAWVHNANYPARKEFAKVRRDFWKNEAENNGGAYGADDVARMQKGKAPIGPDGHPMEIHHEKPIAAGGTNDTSNLRPMSRTDHRLGDNMKGNHPELFDD